MVATTFAIVVMFFPVVFMPGIPGQFFREFGVTVSVAVLFSLLVARLLTPLMAAYFLVPKPAKKRPELPRLYRRALEWALDHRWCVGGTGDGALLCFDRARGAVAEGRAARGQSELPQRRHRSTARLDDRRHARSGHAGSRPAGGAARAESVFAQVGNGGASGGPGGFTSSAGVTKGTVTLILKEQRASRVSEIRDRIRPKLLEIPDARLTFDNAEFGSAGVNIILTSETGEGLEAAGLALQREMRSIRGIVDSRPTTPPSGPEIVIRPKPDEAARLGVSVATIAAAARIATVGDIDANVAKLNEGERRIPIRVRLPRDARADLSVIKNMRIPTAMGGTTTLDTVADVYFQAGPAQISRFDRRRNLTIRADLTGGVQLGDALNKVEALPILKNLPPGLGRASQGQEQALQQLTLGFVIAFAEAIGLVYLRDGVAVPQLLQTRDHHDGPAAAVGGAFLALLLGGSMLGIPSLIGFLMLMGLAAKNSILLVEYAIEREREGHSQREALLEACSERARPIVMTSLAMMAGMLPTALSIGQGSEFRQPMAIAVIGGLITSTVLSLVLVPVVYEFVDDFERWILPRLSRFATPRSAAVHAAEIERH